MIPVCILRYFTFAGAHRVELDIHNRRIYFTDYDSYGISYTDMDFNGPIVRIPQTYRSLTYEHELQFGPQSQ